MNYIKTSDPLYHGFDIVITTWNNLDYLKCTLNSIEKNSIYKHNIYLHINDGSDGTLEWAKKEGIRYTHSESNIGLCKGANQAARLTKQYGSLPYISLLDDDLYLLPKWDSTLYEFIFNNNFSKYDLVSSTMIEPTNGPNTTISPYNYGTHPDNFQEQALLDQYDNLIDDKHMVNIQSTPILLEHEVWDEIGGYNEAFGMGIGSEEALAKQLYDKGARNFVSIGNSLVYHFQTVTTNRLTNRQQHSINREVQFKKLFGITSKEFREKQLNWRTLWVKQ